MRHHGDTFIDLSDFTSIHARVRAIIAHRRFPGACSHGSGRVAMHGEPFEGAEVERQSRLDALGVMDRSTTFDAIREREDRALTGAQ